MCKTNSLLWESLHESYSRTPLVRSAKVYRCVCFRVRRDRTDGAEATEKTVSNEIRKLEFWIVLPATEDKGNAYYLYLSNVCLIFN